MGSEGKSLGVDHVIGGDLTPGKRAIVNRNKSKPMSRVTVAQGSKADSASLEALIGKGVTYIKVHEYDMEIWFSNGRCLKTGLDGADLYVDVCDVPRDANKQINAKTPPPRNELHDLLGKRSSRSTGPSDSFKL